MTAGLLRGLGGSVGIAAAASFGWLLWPGEVTRALAWSPWSWWLGIPPWWCPVGATPAEYPAPEQPEETTDDGR
jgi:hypothetical protein